jgi:hypothetical protein
MPKSRLLAAAITLPLLVSCAGNPARSYVAPAPENALSCALRTTAGLGYTPIAGGVSDGYIKVARKVAFTGADAAQEVGMRVATLGLKGANRTEYDHLTITGAGAALRITAVGINGKNKPTRPSQVTDGHVQAIISGCGLPATDQVAR